MRGPRTSEKMGTGGSSEFFSRGLGLKAVSGVRYVDEGVVGGKPNATCARFPAWCAERSFGRRRGRTSILLRSSDGGIRMLSFAKTPGPAVLRTAKLRRSFPALKPTLRTEYVQNAASCACGGGCPRCRGEAPVQPKLAIGVPGEAFEQEADRIADQVMSMPNPQVHGSPALLGVQRKCAACEEEEKSKLQTKRDQSHAGAATAPPIVHEALRSPGQPLDDSTRAFMEPHFGRDFRTVRVHTDARAADSARAVNALAYTVGRDVVFGGGQYRPRSRAGARLLAHELTHVTQQQGNPPVLARQSPEEKSTDEPEAQALGVEVAPAASQAPDLCQCDPPIPAGESCAARHAEKAVLDAFNEARSWLPGAAQK